MKPPTPKQDAMLMEIEHKAERHCREVKIAADRDETRNGKLRQLYFNTCYTDVLDIVGKIRSEETSEQRRKDARMLLDVKASFHVGLPRNIYQDAVRDIDNAYDHGN